MTEPLTVLMNADAGPGRGAAERALARTLANHGLRAVIEPVDPHQLAGRVADHAGRGMLGVAGGDGTQRTAARGLAGSGTTLVPFPTGTLNHFARRLGLDSVDAAAIAVATGGVRSVPVGRVNGQVFLNTAVVGSYPVMIRVRERLSPYLTTWPAAAIAGLYHLARWTPASLSIRAPSGEREYRTAMFWVGIGAGSFPAPHEAPVAEPDGSLEVAILHGPGRAAAVRLAAALIRLRLGRSDTLDRALDLTHPPWIELDAKGPIAIALDGEPHRLDPPIRIAFEPEALRVIAPR